MKTNIYDMETLGKALWDNYPCYVAYHKYRQTWNVIPIQQYQNMTYANMFGYIVASQFNDKELDSNLTYDQFKLLWLFIYDSFVHHLQQQIIPPRKSPRLD